VVAELAIADLPGIEITEADIWRGVRGAAAGAAPAAPGPARPARVVEPVAPPAPPLVWPAADVPRGPRAPAMWVNTKTSVYHHPHCRWYENTPAGQLMLQAHAQRAGHRPGGCCSR
jgi:hypothetical protein